MLLYHNIIYLYCDNKTTDNNKQKHTIMKAIVKAVKGTYDVKEDLKAEGFSWDKEEKVWVKEYSDIEEFESFKAKT